MRVFAGAGRPEQQQRLSLIMAAAINPGGGK
jgi:hypothetical protein